MIIIEDRFEEALSYLPEMYGLNSSSTETFKPTFMYGDEQELIMYLKLFSESSEIYPIIWLIQPYKEKHKGKRVYLDNISFVLATSTNRNMLNKDRMESTFKKILIPLYDNMMEIFKYCNTIDLAETNNVIKYPGYKNIDGDKNRTVAIWDAIKLDLSCSINDNCLKPIIL